MCCGGGGGRLCCVDIDELDDDDDDEVGGGGGRTVGAAVGYNVAYCIDDVVWIGVKYVCDDGNGCWWLYCIW